MNDLILDFLHLFAVDAFAGFDMFMKDVLMQALHIEDFLSSVLQSGAVSSLYKFIYLFSCSLLALKFMQRGFNIYILWRDGDADSSPGDMVMGIIQGVFIAVAFPFLYDQLAQVIVWFYESINTILNISDSAEIAKITENLLTLGLMNTLIAIAYSIAGIVMWLQMVMRGFQLLVLRIGIPIACIGLVNSDGGVFKAYMGMIFKTTITLMVQAALMSLSYRIISVGASGGLIVGIAALMGAYSIPALFQQFLVSGGGGNITNKIYSTARVVQMAKGLFK